MNRAETTMEYRRLGKHGIKLSALGFGSWLTFGPRLGAGEAAGLMRRAFDRGVNFFDNAEVYDDGRAEEIMGAALRDFPRRDLVVSTKLFWGGKGPNDTGLSMKHLMEGVDASLRRLGLEYVDLLFCHRPDPDTPVEETVRAMDLIIRRGKAFYWGTSEWSAEQIAAAHRAAGESGCFPPAVEQPQYNLLVRRRFEVELAPVFDRYGTGTTIWSPLASGMLTGKYNEGIPEGTRLSEAEWLRQRWTPERRTKVASLASMAAGMGCTCAQLALAWCLKKPRVSSVILGATSPEQLDENLAAVQVAQSLDEDAAGRIEEIFGIDS